MISQSAFIIYDIYDKRDDEVIIELFIGNGQLGASLIKLDSQTFGEYENSFEETIGISKNLKGKTLNIFTTIQDIQPDTNKISLDIILKGGKKKHEQSVINSSVPSHGTVASALITIIFI